MTGSEGRRAVRVAGAEGERREDRRWWRWGTRRAPGGAGWSVCCPGPVRCARTLASQSWSSYRPASADSRQNCESCKYYQVMWRNLYCVIHSIFIFFHCCTFPFSLAEGRLVSIALLSVRISLVILGCLASLLTRTSNVMILLRDHIEVTEFLIVLEYWRRWLDNRRDWEDIKYLVISYRDILEVSKLWNSLCSGTPCICGVSSSLWSAG